MQTTTLEIDTSILRNLYEHWRNGDYYTALNFVCISGISQVRELNPGTVPNLFMQNNYDPGYQHMYASLTTMSTGNMMTKTLWCFQRR